VCTKVEAALSKKRVEDAKEQAKRSAVTLENGPIIQKGHLYTKGKLPGMLPISQPKLLQLISFYNVWHINNSMEAKVLCTSRLFIILV
jgi:hypothetical protein